MLRVVSGAASSTDLEELAQPFVLTICACMSADVHAFTPCSAYLSTSAEWDENTHDLLVLSNLGQDNDVQRALQGGARGYLIKANLSLDELVKAVEQALPG